MKMINELFYTFSTIAQVTASALALLGAFVLFKLQSLNAEIDVFASKIYDLGLSVIGENAREPYHRKNYRQMLEKMEIQLNRQAGSKLDFELKRERLLASLDQRDAILFRYRIAFYLSLSLILFAVLALILAGTIASSPYWAYIFSGIGLVWLGACLLSFAALMKQSFN